VYLTYQLFIPISTTQVKKWLYSFEDQNWTATFLPLAQSFGFSLTCPPDVV
jgi:hypothetical protein